MNMYIRSFTYHIKIQALPFEQVSRKKVLDEYSPDTNLPGPPPHPYYIYYESTQGYWPFPRWNVRTPRNINIAQSEQDHIY